jgi:hypothetical protein
MTGIQSLDAMRRRMNKSMHLLCDWAKLLENCKIVNGL